MADRIDALERLAELRRQGTLAAEEYQTEKDKLLADPGSSAGSGFIHRHRNWLIGVSGFIGLALAVFVIRPLFVNGPVPAVPEGENASEWTISNSRDPMTDIVANTAVRTFTTPAALVEFTISCSSDGTATYRAASFDRDKEPLEMRSRFSDNETTIPFEYRLDGEQPVKNATADPHFNNVAILTTLPLPKVSADMAQLGRESGLTYRNDVPILRASRITFAFHLLNSDPTIAIDQEDAGLKRVLAPCIDVQQKAQAQR